MVTGPNPGVAYMPIYTGEPRREWCDRCLTSAVVAVDLLTMCAEGVTRVEVWAACTRCDPDQFR